MRLKTEIWIQAFLRRCMGLGLFGAVVKRGAADAGALFVIINRQNGNFQLLGPPPGETYDHAGDRIFISEAPFPSTEQAITDILERRKKFDSDLWIIEIEDRDGIAPIKIISP